MDGCGLKKICFIYRYYHTYLHKFRFVEPMLSIAHSCLNRKRSARAHSLTTCPRSGGSSDYIDKFQRLFSAKWIEDKYYIKDI